MVSSHICVCLCATAQEISHLSRNKCWCSTCHRIKIKLTTTTINECETEHGLVWSCVFFYVVCAVRTTLTAAPIQQLSKWSHVVRAYFIHFLNTFRSYFSNAFIYKINDDCLSNLCYWFPLAFILSSIFLPYRSLFSLSLFRFCTNASRSNKKSIDVTENEWMFVLIFLRLFSFSSAYRRLSFWFWRVALSPHHNNNRVNEYIIHIYRWKTCGCIIETTMR